MAFYLFVCFLFYFLFCFSFVYMCLCVCVSLCLLVMLCLLWNLKILIFVDWMECQRRLFEKYWVCSCISVCHINVWWFKEMVRNFALFCNHIELLHLYWWITIWVFDHSLSFNCRVYVLYSCMVMQSSHFVLQLRSQSTTGRNRTVLERLVCLWFMLIQHSNHYLEITIYVVFFGYNETRTFKCISKCRTWRASWLLRECHHFSF